MTRQYCLTCVLAVALAAFAAGDEAISVGAINCGAFHYGTKGVTEGEYSAGWDGLAKDHPADVFFYEDTGNKAYPEGSLGVDGLDIRAAVKDGKGDVAVVELPRTIEVEGKVRKTPRYRALRIVREDGGRKTAFYGLHLVAEGHIKAPKPPKGELSYSQKLRREQFKALIKDAQAFDAAVFAGDFNAQKPFEYEVFTAAGYRIANCSDEFGVHATLRNIPADNIIVSSGLDFLDFEVPQYYRLNTDHYPVIGKIGTAETVKKARTAIPSVERFLALPRPERKKWFMHGGFRKRMLEAGYPDGDGLLSRWVRIEKIPNLRDVGGLKTADGREIRRGLLYRSAGWNDNAKTSKGTDESKWKPGKNRLTEKGRADLAKLGIKTDLDLRSRRECWGMTCSPLGEGVKWVNISFGHYGGFRDRPWARAAVKDAFAVLSDPGNYPLVFHCIGGADRTGCLAMMIEILCGVDEETALKDWELTGCYTARLNFVHAKTIDHLMAYLAEFPGDTPEMRMRAFLAGCGVTDAQMDAVRRILLTQDGNDGRSK